MTVTIMLNRTAVSIEREVFIALFKNSVVSSYKAVEQALDGHPIGFNEFRKLARQAEIPYPLFFAPLDVVQSQVRMKSQKLMAGFTKASFSMHSRHRVDLCDVELIVKDLLRKQELLRKNDDTLVANKIVGLLKNSRRAVVEDAKILSDALGFSLTDLRGARTKDAAVELLVQRLERKQILVSRSAQHFMPQGLPRHAKFSGMTIKDKKVPFIFLATGDEGEHLEPAGRKLFTLTLLTVLIARGTFAPVNYDGHTKQEGSPPEYELTAEILMPAEEIHEMAFRDLQSIRDAAETFRLTPSAVAMRAYRLGRIGRDTFGIYMDALRAEYDTREKTHARTLLPVNALKKYNGVGCSRRMLALLDAGHLNRTEFRRIMFFNKMAVTDIRKFREAVG